MSVRTIRKVITGQSKQDGAGVKLVRVFGYHDVLDFDPFLMLDAFDSSDPADYIKGFPWHPHRGIETVTYLIEGIVEHGDSLGNKGNIMDGDCQWMTAGSGIIHQEMPQSSDKMLGVQLWINLPAKDKMTPPKYRDIVKANIPVVEDKNSQVRIISGNYQGISGAISGEYVKPRFLDVKLNGNSEWILDTDRDSNLFVYIVKGEGCFNPESLECISEKRAILFNEGETFWVKTADEGIRFLLVSGTPLREPIAWGGPIVMNTKAELNQAFKEIDDGNFIK